MSILKTFFLWSCDIEGAQNMLREQFESLTHPPSIVRRPWPTPPPLFASKLRPLVVLTCTMSELYCIATRSNTTTTRWRTFTCALRMANRLPICVVSTRAFVLLRRIDYCKKPVGAHNHMSTYFRDAVVALYMCLVLRKCSYVNVTLLTSREI